MNTISKPTSGPNVQVDIPDDWQVIDRCVPNMRIPHELFGISNGPIPTQSDPERSQPAVAQLGPAALLLWGFYQTRNDPSTVNPVDTLPPYGERALPFDFHEMQIYQPQYARGWDGTRYVWRRTGVRYGDTWVTVMLFSGIDTSEDDLRRVQEVIASFRLN